MAGKKKTLADKLNRMEILDKKIEKLRAAYKRRDSLMSDLLLEVFEKGTYSEETDTYSVKANGKTYNFTPACWGGDKFKSVVFRSVGVEMFNVSIEESKNKKGAKKPKKRK